MVNVLSTEMICYVKLLEFGWSYFDKTEGILYQKVMSKITLPYGVEDEFYYEEVIPSMIHIVSQDLVKLPEYYERCSDG
jgi:hypothetical protein